MCAVNGLVVGAGLHFVVDADIMVASTNAVFLDSHVNVGMVGGPENVGLAKRLPLGTALRMTLQGRNFRLSAQRAYDLGLVDELTEPGNLLSAADQIAHDITHNSPHAVSLSQQAIWSSLEMPYSQAVEYGYGLVKTQWHHPDFTEGFRAFAEKRPPNWKIDSPRWITRLPTVLDSPDRSVAALEDSHRTVSYSELAARSELLPPRSPEKAYRLATGWQS